MSDDDVREALRKAFPPVQYPPALKTATKAEYKTMIRKAKKPGCPLTVLTFVLTIVGLINLFF